MTKTDLLLLTNEYPTRVKFVQAFNETSGGNFLDETTLARQISGNIRLTRPWMAAYRMFEKVREYKAKDDTLSFFFDD